MSEWIKCSERLPEDEVMVLAWMADTYWFAEMCCGDFMIYSDSGTWTVAEKQDVTHWMPLPAAPEAE